MMKRISLVVIGLGIAGASQATIWGFAAHSITGDQEVPPRVTDGFGNGSFHINDQTWDMYGSLNVTNIPLATIVGAHVHEAPVGVNGPVRFDIINNQVPGSPINLPPNITFVYRGTFFAAGTIAQRHATLANIIAGNGYFNVHTQRFPTGEIRGQIHCTGPVPEPATIAAMGLGVAALLRRRRK